MKLIKAVDVFAGAGGWTTGATQAGIHVLMAVNHWQRAVETHRLNHPETKHVCQDLNLLDHGTLPDHDLLLASPSCVGHTRARGRERKHHDATRATAWCVVDIAEVKRPRMLVVENVPEFKDWGLFSVWRLALEALGYTLKVHTFNASDFGTPQERHRVIITGSLGAPLELVSPGLQGAHAREVIDWGGGKWGTTKNRAERTMGCIAHGRATFGDRFLIPYFGNTKISRSVDRPIGTITTKDRYAIVDGGRMRMVNTREATTFMGFPADYVLTGTDTEKKKQLGNAVPVQLARGVCAQLVAA